MVEIVAAYQQSLQEDESLQLNNSIRLRRHPEYKVCTLRVYPNDCNDGRVEKSISLISTFHYIHRSDGLIRTALFSKSPDIGSFSYVVHCEVLFLNNAHSFTTLLGIGATVVLSPS